MSTINPEKRLIDKNQKTDNNEIFKFSDEQRKAVNEARQQIKNGQFLADDQANKEIDEWLGK